MCHTKGGASLAEANSQLDLFHRETDQLREVVDAKIGSVWTAIEGIRQTMDRIVDTLAEQTKNNVQGVLLANTVHHFQETFVEHRTQTEDRLEDHGKRLTAIEKRLEVRETDRKGFWAALAVGITGAAGVVAANFDKIAAVIG